MHPFRISFTPQGAHQQDSNSLETLPEQHHTQQQRVEQINSNLNSQSQQNSPIAARRREDSHHGNGITTTTTLLQPSSPRQPRSAATLTAASKTPTRKSAGSFSPSLAPPSSSPRLQTQQTTTRTTENPTLPPSPDLIIRTLPPRSALTDSTLTTAYTTFILYANPSIPANVDTSELRRIFRSPPRSDGKSFSTFRLWELICRLEAKEIKTWTQLAIELGVEPPDTERGQSVQKIQQYAVRLKRWMHAMHVDAFFEYCLGKEHVYYTELPSATSGIIEQARDGVPVEEDLALRALLPEWKPKRGRKRAEDKMRAEEDGLDGSGMSVKRGHLDAMGGGGGGDEDGLEPHSALFMHSAYPWSAFPDGRENAWPPANAAAAAAAQLWNQGDDPRMYPQSAVVPGLRSVHALSSQLEPQSAITPSSSSSRNKSKSRRRHGPAVSSAWLGSGSSSIHKSRGRPPTNRATQDGPFSTFPVTTQPEREPTPKTSPRIVEPATSSDHAPTPPITLSQYSQNEQPSFSSSTASRITTRPSKLQLQVPQHAGRPVRLATPPMLTLNDNVPTLPPAYQTTSSLHSRRSSADFFRDIHTDNESQDDGRSSVVNHSHGSGGDLRLDFTIDDIAKAFAASLMRAEIVTTPESIRAVPLGMDEALALAYKCVLQMGGLQDVNIDTHRNGRDAFLLMCAIRLGVERALGLEMGREASVTVFVAEAEAADTTSNAIVHSEPRQGGSSSSAQASNNSSVAAARKRKKGKDAPPTQPSTPGLIYTIEITTNTPSSIKTTTKIQNLTLPALQQSPQILSEEISHLRSSLASFIHPDKNPSKKLDALPPSSSALRHLQRPEDTDAQGWKARCKFLEGELERGRHMMARMRRGMLEVAFCADGEGSYS